MIIDIQNAELRDFTYITNVFKCISNYNLMGHQIGRKVGDMLELITMGAVYRNEELRSKLSTEKGLEGFTTAEHKVEFGFFNTAGQQKELFGAIECKCVGVEETKAVQGGRHFRKLIEGQSFTIPFAADWQTKNVMFTCTLVRVLNNAEVDIQISADSQNPFDQTMTLSVEDCFRVVMDEHSNCLVATPNGNMMDEIPTIIRTCKAVHLERISNGVVTFALYNCLPGPQTIEKAKQASLVAMDLRKKVDGYWGKEEIPAGEKKMTFVHVLCEFSHWEEKSRNVIKTCIDHNIVVPDAVIIKSFEVFEERFGTDGMLDKIAKKRFNNDAQIRDAVYSILDYFENRVFYDIALNRYVEFGYANNALVITPMG